MNKPHILIVGPYITNYSLAKVNRGLALALSQIADVKIWQNPDIIQLDKIPTAEDLKANPDVAALLTDDVSDIDIVIYNSFPRSPELPYNLAALPGKVKLMYLAWEETVFPGDKVEEINQNLHGVMVASSFTKQILERNGVRVPIMVVPNAINTSLAAGKYSIDTSKSFKFLHVSTAKQRKGVDVLLKAYFAEFNANDDVTLVIKSFPGPENNVNSLLGELAKQYSNPPEVVHIFNPNLTEQELINLTASADCAVYPTRTEGFGLPIAEAMYYETPVIVTGYSGHMDFCDEDSVMLLDYELVPALDSEMVNLGAKWAEPSQADLQKNMRYVFEHKGKADPKIKSMTELAHAKAAKLTWENSANQVLEFVTKIEALIPLKQKSIAVLGAINSVNGIAQYTKDLYNNVQASFARFNYIANYDIADQTVPDEQNVLRLWETGGKDFAQLFEWLAENKPDIFHMQIHPGGEIDPDALGQIIEHISTELPATEIYFTPHIIKSDSVDISVIKDSLQKVKVILAHKQSDQEYLQQQGLTNVLYFPHPYLEFPIREQSRLKRKLGITEAHPILITHGLASHNKGLFEVADAVAKLKSQYPDILWIAANAVTINNSTSSDTYLNLQQNIENLGIQDNVVLIPEFLDLDQVELLMQASDIGICAYIEVGESSSSVLPKHLAAGHPTIVTDISISKHLDKEVYKIPNNYSETIAAAITKLTEDPKLTQSITSSAKELTTRLNYTNQRLKLLQMYASHIQ